MVFKVMQDEGYEIIFVNLMIDEVFGVKVVVLLKDVEGLIDIVNVFRCFEQFLGVVEEFLQIDVFVFWVQQGFVNEEVYCMIIDKGRMVVMDLCIKVVCVVIKQE